MMNEWYQCSACNNLHQFSWRDTPNCSSCHSDTNLRKLEDVIKNHFMHLESNQIFSSSSTDFTEHESFKQLIQFGKTDANRFITHLILEEIHNKPSHLFSALHQITSANPLSPEMAGNILLQCKTWVDWGKREGLIWISAQKVDIIEVIPSHYDCEFQVGERFVVLGTLSDTTAIVMDKNGKTGTLSFPEEYIVVDTMDDLFAKWIVENVRK